MAFGFPYTCPLVESIWSHKSIGNVSRTLILIFTCSLELCVCVPFTGTLGRVATRLFRSLRALGEFRERKGLQSRIGWKRARSIRPAPERQSALLGSHTRRERSTLLTFGFSHIAQIMAHGSWLMAHGLWLFCAAALRRRRRRRPPAFLLRAPCSFHFPCFLRFCR